MANMFIVPRGQVTNDVIFTDEDGARYYDLAALDYFEVDLGEIPEYTGELKYSSIYGVYLALDFEGADSYTSDLFSPNGGYEYAFIAITPDQSINRLTDVLMLYFNRSTEGAGYGYTIVSKAYPDLNNGNLSAALTKPWLLVNRNGSMCIIATETREPDAYNHPWELAPIANYSTGAVLPAEAYHIAGGLPSITYGWTDGGTNDDPEGKSITLVQGFNVSGCWRCQVRASTGTTFKWYKDGALIATETDRAKSDCRPSADDAGVFTYHCEVTLPNGRVLITDPLVVTVTGDDPGEDPDNPGGGGDDPDTPGEVTNATKLASFQLGIAVGLGLKGGRHG